MMTNRHPFDWTFPSLNYGDRHARLDLGVLLFKGGARAHALKVASLIADGCLGDPRMERVPLLTAIHDYLRGELAAGGSEKTLRTNIAELRALYQFADDADADLQMANVASLFKRWISHRYRAARQTPIVIFHQGAGVARTLSQAMGVNRAMLIAGTRLRYPKDRKRVLGTQADKQVLSDAFSFGRDIVDLIESLSLEACLGPLPIAISLRSLPEPIQHWLSLKPPEQLVVLTSGRYSPGEIKEAEDNRRRISANATVQMRYSIINMRIQAEFLLFISQTGMNPGQAAALTVGDYRYESWQEGYRVRKYKGRRKGEVEFEIYSEYRPHFERYLTFREAVFGADEHEQLFVLCGQGARPWSGKVNPQALRQFLMRAGRKFVPARELRSTRVNWLLRHADDPGVVATMGQHSVETMHRSYERPHHQRACVEWSQFYVTLDAPLHAVAPGSCQEVTPKRDTHFVGPVPEPDCINPAGCLFCSQYRGIESLDYIWSILSFRHLKSRELALYRLPRPDVKRNVLQATLERVAETIEGFRGRGEQHESWWSEADARISEDHHHPRWAGFIVLAEALG